MRRSLKDSLIDDYFKLDDPPTPKNTDLLTPEELEAHKAALVDRLAKILVDEYLYKQRLKRGGRPSTGE